MTDAQTYTTGMLIIVSIALFVGFALGEKNAEYGCSPAQAERIYMRGADRLYEQLVEQGRIKE